MKTAAAGVGGRHSSRLRGRLDEGAAADDVLDQALVAEQAHGLAGGQAGHAVLLGECFFGWDRASYCQFAGGDPGAQDRGQLLVNGRFALMIDLHMITLSRLHRALFGQGRM